MQREALLAKAVMHITQLINTGEKMQHITKVQFGCSSAALVLKRAADEFVQHAGDQCLIGDAIGDSSAF